MFTIVSYRAEGPKDNFTRLGSATAIYAEKTKQAAVEALEYEAAQLRKTGAEVIQCDEETYLVIDESDRVCKVLEIV